MITVACVHKPAVENQALNSPGTADAFLWLEDVESESALAWVAQKNQGTLSHLQARPEYASLKSDAETILNAQWRIPYLTRRGQYWYNFWQDANSVKGIYRRTTLASYQSGQPQWETIIDFDQLSKVENKSWVYKGMECLAPEYTRCLLSLSDGGADAVVIREFDLLTKQFVDQGFALPEAKSAVQWLDIDHLLVGTHFNADSMTDSGYPREVKVWQRGEPLSEAEPVMSTDVSSVGLYPFAFDDFSGASTRSITLLQESLTFFTANYYLLRDSQLQQLDLPNDAELKGYYHGALFISLRSPWQGFAPGSIVYAPLTAVLTGDAQYRALAEPSDERSVDDIQFANEFILINWQNRVKSQLERIHFNADEGVVNRAFYPVAENGVIQISNVASYSNQFTLIYEDMLTPPSYYLMTGDIELPAPMLQTPPSFEADDLVVEQWTATSVDGTLIPYFIVHHENLSFDGSHPTLLYGYGGFEISMQPNYMEVTGKLWLQRGGIFVLANIRGGGEFGPKWHQAALKQNRHKAFEDFESVARDLIERGVTSPEHLGIRGGSNGGLLVGAVAMRTPELFNAVVCEVPLLDMQRYHRLLAGASWMGEYGDPDIDAEWQYIKSYSPYHNIKADIDYPVMYFTTSTRDDRVHPGHARKMVAKMESLGHPAWYFENTEGGHAAAADNQSRAERYALIYAYLNDALGLLETRQ